MEITPPPRRSSREGRGKNCREDKTELKEPNPPFPNAKDASYYDDSFLLTLNYRNQGWFNRLDFVNVSGDLITRLFLSDRI